MVRPIALVAFCLIVGCGCTPPYASVKSGSDPIQRLVDKLSADRSGEWVNGVYPSLDLPLSATAEEVIDGIFRVVTFDEGTLRQFQIRELRGVVSTSLRPERYNEAIVEINVGRKLVLFRRERLDWWSRIYEMETST